MALTRCYWTRTYCQSLHALAPGRAAMPTLAFAAFSFESNLNACSKVIQTGSHLGRDDPKRCNQIKIMPFIQTCLAQSESASPKATTLYVYTMSLFRVVCLLNRWKSASSARCLQKKARGLTTPRSSKPPSPDSADVIGAEIEVSQRCALPQHSCKALGPVWSDFPIASEIEVSQRCALRQHSCKALCPACCNVIADEIEDILNHSGFGFLGVFCKRQGNRRRFRGA